MQKKGSEERSFRPRACKMKRRRVYLRSPIEVHYVDINNSAQKCRPSRVSPRFRRRWPTMHPSRPSRTPQKPQKITKEPQTKFVSAGSQRTMQKRWKAASRDTGINCPTTRFFPPSLVLFLFTKRRRFSFVSSSVTWEDRRRARLEMKRRFRRKLICNCCHAVGKYRWIYCITGGMLRCITDEIGGCTTLLKSTLNLI